MSSALTESERALVIDTIAFVREVRGADVVDDVILDRTRLIMTIISLMGRLKTVGEGDVLQILDAMVSEDPDNKRIMYEHAARMVMLNAKATDTV